MQYKGIPPWKIAPFLRIIIPFIVGVIFQFYFEISVNVLYLSSALLLAAFLGINYLSVNKKFRLRNVQGFCLQFFIFFFACLLTFNSDVRNSKDWYGHSLNDSSLLIVKINEPLVKKPATSKSEAFVEFIINKNSKPVKGKIIIYFGKDSNLNIKYGQRLLLHKPLTEIKNSGNPGAFNFKRYSSFQGIIHTAYLLPGDYELLDIKPNAFRGLLFKSRQFVLEILSHHFKDAKVRGIAEALLIGYKENLDKDLLQAYSNTGVVHIIAISGLHLGLIYIVLVWIYNRFKFLKKSKFVKVFFILTGLWLFSFLTGGSASVLRSAVMFSCILIGETYFKKSSTYNTMAASAFLLLCYNPFYLWDVGFMLSFLAVFGIAWIQRPLFHSLYIKNKFLSGIWNMISVTVAAQIMAFPLCIYYFHQFPNLFILTNSVAVPLSTIILFSELFLIIFFWLPFIEYAGKLTGWLLYFMNSYIEKLNSFSFSVTDSIFANALSTWLLYFIVLSVCAGLILRKKIFLKGAFIFLFVFIINHSFECVKAVKQQHIIIYNVPGKMAIDFISGNEFYFMGDTALHKKGMLQNFHLNPGRIKLMSSEVSKPFKKLKTNENFISFNGKKLFLVEDEIYLSPQSPRLKVDIIVITKNAKIKLKNLIMAIEPQIIVLDGTNNLWKIAAWKKECEALHLRCHSVAEDGAYILTD